MITFCILQGKPNLGIPWPLTLTFMLKVTYYSPTAIHAYLFLCFFFYGVTRIIFGPPLTLKEDLWFGLCQITHLLPRNVNLLEDKPYCDSVCFVPVLFGVPSHGWTGDSCTFSVQRAYPADLNGDIHIQYCSSDKERKQYRNTVSWSPNPWMFDTDWHDCSRLMRKSSGDRLQQEGWVELAASGGRDGWVLPPGPHHRPVAEVFFLNNFWTFFQPWVVP